jgi:hypothetical protein
LFFSFLDYHFNQKRWWPFALHIQPHIQKEGSHVGRSMIHVFSLEALFQHTIITVIEYIHVNQLCIRQSLVFVVLFYFTTQ